VGEDGGHGFGEVGGRVRSRLPPITSVGQLSRIRLVVRLGRHQHAIDRRIARRIVAQPSRSVLLKPGDVNAKLDGISVPHQFLVVPPR
jgi:hypothetical protein